MYVKEESNMSVENVRAHELDIPINPARPISVIIPEKIYAAKKIRQLVEETDWERQIIKREKWIDRFCFSVLGCMALYFGVVCLKVLIG